MYGSCVSSRIDLLQGKKYWFFALLPSLLCMYGLFPGRIYSDSASLIELMRNNESSDQWSALYFRYLQLLTFDGKFLFLASSINLLCLTFSIYLVIQSTKISDKVKKKTFIILNWTPFIGVFGMTVGRDTVATSGMLILLSQILQKNREQYQFVGRSKILLTLGIFMSCMSIIGCAFLVGLAFVFALNEQRLLGLVTLILVVFNLTYMSSALQVSRNSEKLYIANVLGDIKCIVQHPDAVVSQEQWRTISKLGSIQKWKDPKSCWLADYSYFALDSASLSSGQTLSLWRSLVLQNPQISIVARIQRSSVALPPVLFNPPPNMISLNYDEPVGLGTQDDLQKFSELFKTSIDSKYFANQNLPLQRILESMILFSALIFNQNSQIWGWAGMWLVVSFLLGRKITDFSRLNFFKTISPLVVTHLIIVMASPAPNPRYLMTTTIFGIIIGLIRLLTINNSGSK